MTMATLDSLKQSVSPYVSASMSGAMLAMASLYPAYYALAWVAFIPLLHGLHKSGSVYHAYKLGLVSGMTLYGMSTYWLVDFILIFKEYDQVAAVAASSLYWFYCAHMIAIISVLTWYSKRIYPLVWLFPVLVVIAFAYYPTLFSAQVGDTQSEFLVALQGISYTGVHGLDFIVALVNVLIYQALFGNNDSTKYTTAIAYGLIVLWFGFGIVSLQVWESSFENGPALKVGMVQANHPAKAPYSGPQPGYSLGYPIEMSLTEKLVENNVDMVIWPENVNKYYYSNELVRSAFQRHIRELRTPLIFHDYETQVNEGKFWHYSTSTFIDKEGNEAGKYHKIKRIAFAEYLPLLDDSVTIKRSLHNYLGDFFSDLKPGLQSKAFLTGKAAVIPLICYEVMFPEFVANSVPAEAYPAILITQSNNSWFGETRQPFQHLASSALRSVENRMPLVHVMNNGPSGVILPSGRQIMQTEYQKTVAYAVGIPLSNTQHRSFYSNNPRLFIYCLTIVFIIMALRLGYSKITDKKASVGI
jgi:apolipoprotein N-acyltransferase